MDARATSAFGELLRHYRVAAGLSQERLAERTGLSARGVSDLERGARRVPRLETVRLLADGLGLDPVDRASLLRSARPLHNASAPQGSPPALAPRPPSLPIPPTPLIGRERELAGVVSMLADSQTRLVTLTGPGGVGKTRLAVEVATAVGRSSDGMHFVDLTPLKDPALVDAATAEVLGVREAGGLSLAGALERFLGEKRLLLVLDNFEHVLPAASLVVDLLAHCPSLKVLITSRVPLGLRSERQFPVPPLELPAPDSAASPSDVSETGAVRLFVARARDVKPDFATCGDNAATVAEICRRLDGLPLALELAAVRTKVLSPATLLSRLDHRLPLLKGSAPDAPARHRTLHATIAWSHELLDHEERLLFRRLAVFAGGCTIEAAEAVCALDRDIDVFETLASLVDKSLIWATESRSGEPRFGMLETIREFALEQLDRSDEVTDLCGRHARYFLSLARAGAGNLADAEHGGWLARIEAEQVNMRVALAWLRDRGQLDDGLRLATALGSFWHLRSANTEGRAWLDTFLSPDTDTTLPATERISALRWAGELAGLEGDLAAAETRLAESLALARRIGDAGAIAAALAGIGSMAVLSGDVAGSVGLFAEAAAIAREQGDRRQAAYLTAYLAFCHGHLGNLKQAETLISESDALLRSLGDVRSFEVNFTVLGQGWLAVLSHDYIRAVERLDEALALGREIDAKGNVSIALAGLGEIAIANAQLNAAANHYREGLEAGHEGDFPPGEAWNLQGLVRVAVGRGEHERAARLAGALDVIVGRLGSLPTVIVDRYKAALMRLRQSIGNDEFEAQATIGRSLSSQALIAEAAELSTCNMP